MYMKKLLTFAMAAVMALALLAGCGNTAADDNGSTDQPSGGSDTAAVSGTVSTDGSTSMEKVIGALSESYMAANKDVTVNYNPTGSGSGITAVQEGTCDIGLSSRALKDEEKAAGLQETVLAYDGIAIIVHPDNPVSDLTLDQIAKLYTGEITNWKDVGGNDAAVVLIGREAASGSIFVLNFSICSSTVKSSNSLKFGCSIYTYLLQTNGLFPLTITISFVLSIFNNSSGFIKFLLFVDIFSIP